ncbi:S-layer homology domain-containing protein [Paenibacillus sp. N3.4]|uniref:S-layer homology domain-containing protein n=1 Tax=Paenibacillus sp. N3.4 TaxID=2603222 RepID=UPI0011CA89C3|nr:S-layer homology domain-containing protein [Paenibacillus sp. N3.4]TXK76726.1 hypothetical protein FU659_24960 [Paenibacillus sp. N3.4]
MTRKKAALLTSIVLAIAIMLPQLAMASASSPSLSIQASSSYLSKDEEFTVTIQGNDLDDLYAYQLNLYYDADKFSFKSGSEIASTVGFNVPAKVSEDGGPHLVFAHTKTGSAAGDNGSIKLVSFVFKATKDATTQLSLKNSQLIHSNLTLTSLPDSVSSAILIGPSSDNSNPNPGTSAPVSTPSETRTTVTPDQLKDIGTGKVTVEVKGTSTELTLPGNTSELLGNNALVVKAEGAKLELPAIVFRQLEQQLTSAQFKDGTVSLTIKPTEFRKETKFAADTKLGGHVYEFRLQWKSADGSTYDLHQFNQPVTIRMPLDVSMNPKLSAIYYLPEGAEPEYVGGTYTEGELVATINHFSSYAILEVNKSFSDVPENHWASKVIKELAAKQIIGGTGANAFEPSRNITRAEFTALLVRTLHLTKVGSDAFEDVPAQIWYARDISIAYQAGLIQGTSETKFSPDATITREEMAVLAMRTHELLKGKSEATSQGSFTDESQISSWALGYAQKVNALGLIQGRETGAFVPQGSLTRAEAAQVIYRLLNE